MNINLNKLSSVKVTRYEFLIYIGVLLLGISGISSIFKLVSNENPKYSSRKIVKKTAPRVFGAGAYGV